jgi:hypothetical protein
MDRGAIGRFFAVIGGNVGHTQLWIDKGSSDQALMSFGPDHDSGVADTKANRTFRIFGKPGYDTVGSTTGWHVHGAEYYPPGTPRERTGTITTRVSFPVSKESAQRMRDYITDVSTHREEHPYSLLREQCTTSVTSTLKSGTVQIVQPKIVGRIKGVGKISTLRAVDARDPGRLQQALRKGLIMSGQDILPIMRDTDRE